MDHSSEAFVGFDTSKLRHSVAIADYGRTGEESWSRKSAQEDKWSFCLTTGTLCPANQERP
jgi:hypothetical protein